MVSLDRCANAEVHDITAPMVVELDRAVGVLRSSAVLRAALPSLDAVDLLVLVLATQQF